MVFILSQVIRNKPDTWYGTISIYSILTTHTLVYGRAKFLEHFPSNTQRKTSQELTLEQTINADAASRLTGIAAFTSSADARTRWMVTHSARSSHKGHLLEMAGLKPKEDSSKELRRHRIERDHEDLSKITSFMQDTLNPFTTNSDDDNIYCLTTGKAATDGVKMDLLKCCEIGIKWCGKFKEECFKH